MIDALRTYVKTLLEQEEQERNEEQEIDSIKDLFQRWINEYKASYFAHRKNVHSDSWDIARISVKELGDFIFISLDFKEYLRNDWSIIAYNKENKNIYCVNTQARADAGAALTLTFSLTFAFNFPHCIEHRSMSKISVDQFRRVMDVTKGNYIQFEALTSRLSEMNKKNANV